MRAIRSFALLLALALVPGAATAAEGPKGPLLIAGGEFSFGNPGWPRFVEAATRAGGPILVIPTASGDPQGSGGRVVEHLTRLGAAAELVPLTKDSHAAATDAAWVAKAEAAGGFWFTGGEQARITAALLRPDGGDTPLLAAIRRANARGAIVGGSSAGAAIMSAMMFKDGPEPLDALRDGLEAGRHTDRGLGFIGTGWFVDQHFLARGRLGRMVVAMRDLGYGRGVGVEEDTAILVGTDGTAEVVGAKGVVLAFLDGADMSKGAPFTLSGGRVTFATAGDRVDLSSGALLPSAARAALGPIDPTRPDFKPYYRGEAAWYADMLGPGILYEAMIRTLDSDAGRVAGLAFRPGHRTGFEIVLTRTDASRGWFASGEGGYSITDLRLDIRPVTMAEPLFHPMGR